MRPPTTTIHPIYLEVQPAEIALIKFLFESYEGVGIVRTLNRHAAVIVILVVPDFLDTARDIIAALQREFECREIPEPEIAADDWLLKEELAG